MIQSNYFYHIRLDSEGTVILTSGKFQNQLSIFQDNLIGNSFSEILYPKDFSNYQLLLEKALNDHQSNFVIEMRKSKPDGSDFHWTRWEFTISANEQGQIIVDGIGHEIQKSNEKNIEFPDFHHEHLAKNEIMEGLFEDNLIGFWVWDIANNRDQLSNSLKKMLGYDTMSNPHKEVLWMKNIHSSDEVKVKEQLNDHFKSLGRIPFQSEFRVISYGGKIFWVIGYGKVVNWDNEGNPLMMIGCFFDISEKKKSEVLLEKQSQFLKELTFNQSHTMRSKLANIMGILEVMDSKSYNRETASYLNLIKDEAKKLDEVLKKSITNSSALNYDMEEI